jgi:hypothetical protein
LFQHKWRKMSLGVAETCSLKAVKGAGAGNYCVVPINDPARQTSLMLATISQFLCHSDDSAVPLQLTL